jgi:hypothetical protein
MQYLDKNFSSPANNKRFTENFDRVFKKAKAVNNDGFDAQLARITRDRHLTDTFMARYVVTSRELLYVLLGFEEPLDTLVEAVAAFSAEARL